MHLGGAGIGKANVNPARDQGPHQTFRTVHHSLPWVFSEIRLEINHSRRVSSKGPGDIAAIQGGAIIAGAMTSFLTAASENSPVAGSLLAQSPQLWPVLRPNRALETEKMMRVFALLLAVVTVLACTGQARAEDFDSRDVMGGGPNFRAGGANPILRETITFNGEYAPGTIFISTAERRLYLVLPNGQALRYGIGVGRDGFRWSGTHRITAKKEWPSWTPPSQMLARRPDLPRHMAGGIDNPLGARAMYLGSTLYRIHGSNEPETIGQAVSSGCFRMTNDDVTDLYNRVSVGATVVVKN